MSHQIHMPLTHTNLHEYFSCTVEQHALHVSFSSEVNQQLTDSQREEYQDRICVAMANEVLGAEAACDLCSKVIDEFITELQGKGKLLLKKKLH